MTDRYHCKIVVFQYTINNFWQIY